MKRTIVWTVGLCSVVLVSFWWARRHWPRTDERITTGGRADPPLPRFTARRELILEGRKTCGVLATDWDGDGQLDLVTATRTDGLYVFRGGDGSLAGLRLPARVEVGGYPLGPVRMHGRSSDLVVVVSQATREVSFLRTGPSDAGRLAASIALDATPLAIVPGSTSGRSLGFVWILTEGPESLAGAQAVLVDTQGCQGRFALDEGTPTCALWLPGSQGLLVGYQNPSGVAFYPADDALRLGRPAWSRRLAGIPRDMVQAELDGDPAPELAVCGGDRSLWVFGLPPRAGSALPPWREPVADPLDCTVGSVPIDIEILPGARGEDDVIGVLGLESLDVTLVDGFRVQGPPSVRRVSAGQTPWSLTSGDFDGDGRVDLAVANRDAYRVSVLEGCEGGGFSSAARVPTLRGPRSIAMGDWDADGDVDVLVATSVAHELQVFGNERGVLRDVGRVDLGEGVRFVAGGELDGDGYPDFVFLRRDVHGAEVGVVRGSSTGFSEPRTYPVGGDPGPPRIVDLDGQAPLEVLLPDPRAAGVRVLCPAAERAAPLGDGGVIGLGGHPTCIDVSPSAQPRRLVAALSERDGGPVLVLLSRRPGAGVLAWEEQVCFPLRSPARDAAFADVDGDGLEDLVALTGGSSDLAPGALCTWLAPREGASWTPLAEQTTGLHPFRLALGDLDLDGRCDVVVSAKHSHQINVWLARDGDPVNLLRLPDLGVGQGPLDLALADLDDDGRLDLVVCNHYGASLSTVANPAPRLPAGRVTPPLPTASIDSPR